jgi:protein farnesyltransferase/geranylgeranyltransferase type-1 subunit alpha
MSIFSHRAGWEDIAIVKQDDGPIPIVQIAYTADFTNLMDLFRGVLAIGEYSERVLDLTKEILCNHNAANYTVWYENYI